MCQGCILSPCLFNLCAEYIMWNARLDEAQTAIKIAGRNINKLRYTDDTILMAESKEKLKSLLMKVQSLNRVQLFAVPWTAAHQASLSITNSRSLLKLMSIESMIPSNHITLCHCLLLLLSIFPSTRVFPSESVLCIRWPKYWSFSFSISS